MATKKNRNSKHRRIQRGSRRPSSAYSSGARLAVEMLRHFQNGNDILENCTIEGDYRPEGKPQHDIVGAFLKNLSNAEEVAGFTSMLTHWIAMSERCGTPDLDYMRLLATMPWEKAQREWQRQLAMAKAKAAQKRVRELGTVEVRS